MDRSHQTRTRVDLARDWHRKALIALGDKEGSESARLRWPRKVGQKFTGFRWDPAVYAAGWNDNELKYT